MPKPFAPVRETRAQNLLLNWTLTGGEVPGSGGKPAFTLYQPAHPAMPVLIAAPHGGRDYAPALQTGLRNPGQIAHRLEDRHIDSLALEVARACGASLLVAHAPRALIDLNRGIEDMDWSMVHGADRSAARPAQTAMTRRAATGLGLVPRRLAMTGEVWKAPLALRDVEERMALVHRPYHAALGEALRDIHRHWGAALLIDLHSMPPLKSAGEPVHYVIGDLFGASCGEELVSAALSWLSGQRQPVAHNRPYAGGYVLDRHGLPWQGIHAMQIEVCRSLYLDPHHRDLTGGIVDVAAVLTGLVRTLAGVTIDSVQAGPSVLAAE